jgi:hypothetical protein
MNKSLNMIRRINLYDQVNKYFNFLIRFFQTFLIDELIQFDPELNKDSSCHRIKYLYLLKLYNSINQVDRLLEL